jgi:glutamyl-tRNA synthetase
MAEQTVWLVRDELDYDDKAVQKHLRPVAAPLLAALRAGLAEAEPWNEATLEKVFEQVAVAQGDVKIGKLAQPARVAVTGRSMSPGIYETLEVVGRDRCLDRLDAAIAIAEARAAAS